MNKNNLTPKERYEFLINARNFHYDNFNKWMTYYYLAVAAIFVGFYSMEDSDNSSKLCLLIVGYVVSVLWHLSCKGYYFWVKHWTTQLLELENLNDYRVYSVFSKSVKKNENNLLCLFQSANISTSKITLLFSFFISTTWFFLILNNISFEIFCSHNNILNNLLEIICSLLITIAIVWFLGQFLKSDLTKHKIE